MKFSVVIPAHDEAGNIGRCLDAIARAATDVAGRVEVIVVLNRCTDATESIARERGAKIIRDDSRNIAMIRNAGVRAATGEIIVTIDADSVMSPNMLNEVAAKLGTGKFIGGGVPIRMERVSLGILLTGALIFSFIPPGISLGMFWCRREDFEALGGFNEALRVAEDVDFAKRLRAHGRKKNKRYGTLWKTRITTSTRKFDRLGDWYFVLRPRSVWLAVRGIDDGCADKLWYDFKR